MASIDFQLPNIPFDQLRRHACLEMALKWAEPDIHDLETSTRDIVKAAEAFERFVGGTLGVIDEQPPEPIKADAPKTIRVWVSRDKNRRESRRWISVFKYFPPVKEEDDNESVTFVAGDGGDCLITELDPANLGFDLAPGDVVEAEITIRKIG